MHHNPITQQDEKQKSDIQIYYNENKSGVDVCDKMVKEYSVRVVSRRWLMVHFHNQLDVTGINSFTVYNYHYPEWSSNPVMKRRREFLRELANGLAMEYVLTRLSRPIGLQTQIICLMEQFSGQQRGPSSMSDVSAAGDGGDRMISRCQRCRDDGKLTRNCSATKNKCNKCNDPVFGNHVS